jgi:CheY-like chemotaxis protein
MNDLRRILLAEDNEKDVELTLTSLEQNNLANEVDVVHDGEEALNYLYRRGKFQTRPEGHPAVVLLDIKMPKVDGLQVLRQIKADSQLKTIPAVILTSSREERDLIEGYRLGANAYVIKPVDFQQFMEAIKQVGAFWAIVNQPPPEAIR